MSCIRLRLMKTLRILVGFGLMLGLTGGTGCGTAPAGDGAAAGGDQAATATEIPDFADTGGADTKVTFNRTPGVPTVSMRGASKGLQLALDEMTRQGSDNNEKFTAASFKFPSEALSELKTFGTLKKGHACDLDPLQIAFDAMFFSLEPKRDGEDAHNSLDGDGMTCNPVNARASTANHRSRSLLSETLQSFRAGDAYAAIVDPNNDPKISDADLKKLVAASDTAVKSFMKGNDGASIFSCSWGNADDETGSAVLSIDAKSGEVRVLFGFVGP